MIVALSSFPRRNYPLIFYYICFMRVAIKISLLADVFFLNYKYKLLVRRVRFERTNPKDTGLQPAAALQLCRLPILKRLLIRSCLNNRQLSYGHGRGKRIYNALVMLLGLEPKLFWSKVRCVCHYTIAPYGYGGRIWTCECWDQNPVC